VHLEGVEEMSGKLQQVIDKLQKANNTIEAQRKEIERLKALALKSIVKEHAVPRELSDDEIADLLEEVNEETGRCSVRIFDHAKVLLRKLKEKYERESKENN
jgi:hypothetical protein